MCSIIGIFFVRTTEEKTGEVGDHLLESLLASINTGIYTAAGLFIVAALVLCYILLSNAPELLWLRVYASCVFGLLAGIAIGAFTEWSTS